MYPTSPLPSKSAIYHPMRQLPAVKHKNCCVDLWYSLLSKLYNLWRKTDDREVSESSNWYATSLSLVTLNPQGLIENQRRWLYNLHTNNRELSLAPTSDLVDSHRLKINEGLPGNRGGRLSGILWQAIALHKIHLAHEYVKVEANLRAVISGFYRSPEGGMGGKQHLTQHLYDPSVDYKTYWCEYRTGKPGRETSNR